MMKSIRLDMPTGINTHGDKVEEKYLSAANVKLSHLPEKLAQLQQQTDNGRDRVEDLYKTVNLNTKFLQELDNKYFELIEQRNGEIEERLTDAIRKVGEMLEKKFQTCYADMRSLLASSVEEVETRLMKVEQYVDQMQEYTPTLEQVLYTRFIKIEDELEKVQGFKEVQIQVAHLATEVQGLSEHPPLQQRVVCLQHDVQTMIEQMPVLEKHIGTLAQESEKFGGLQEIHSQVKELGVKVEKMSKGEEMGKHINKIYTEMETSTRKMEARVTNIEKKLEFEKEGNFVSEKINYLQNRIDLVLTENQKISQLGKDLDQCQGELAITRSDISEIREYQKAMDLELGQRRLTKVENELKQLPKVLGMDKTVDALKQEIDKIRISVGSQKTQDVIQQKVNSMLEQNKRDLRREMEEVKKCQQPLERTVGLLHDQIEKVKIQLPLIRVHESVENVVEEQVAPQVKALQRQVDTLSHLNKETVNSLRNAICRIETEIDDVKSSKISRPLKQQTENVESELVLKLQEKVSEVECNMRRYRVDEFMEKTMAAMNQKVKSVKEKVPSVSDFNELRQKVQEIETTVSSVERDIEVFRSTVQPVQTQMKDLEDRIDEKLSERKLCDVNESLEHLKQCIHNLSQCPHRPARRSRSTPPRGSETSTAEQESSSGRETTRRCSLDRPTAIEKKMKQVEAEVRSMGLALECVAMACRGHGGSSSTNREPQCQSLLEEESEKGQEPIGDGAAQRRCETLVRELREMDVKLREVSSRQRHAQDSCVTTSARRRGEERVSRGYSSTSIAVGCGTLCWPGLRQARSRRCRRSPPQERAHLEALPAPPPQGATPYNGEMEPGVMELKQRVEGLSLDLASHLASSTHILTMPKAPRTQSGPCPQCSRHIVVRRRTTPN